eukprot:COSAG02_NODE_1316_length_13310_cov_22.515101_5_plen_381_part_00
MVQQQQQQQQQQEGGSAVPRTMVPRPPADPIELARGEGGGRGELEMLCGRAQRAYRERSFKRAVRLYSLALAMGQHLGVPLEQQAILFHNRACANVQRPGTQAYGDAVRDAERAKSCCRQTERAQYDLALMMVRNKDNRLQPDFQWYPDQTLGNRRRNDPVAKRLMLPAPHTARFATLRPVTTLLPRLSLTDRGSRPRKTPGQLTLGDPLSPMYAQKDYQVPTPEAGTDTSLMDRESRKIATAIAKEVEYEKAVEEYAQRDAAAAARRERVKERDNSLMLDLDAQGDPLLRSVTPELDILTPAVIRDGLVRQTSQKIYSEMKAQQTTAMDSSVVAEKPEEEGQEQGDSSPEADGRVSPPAAAPPAAVAEDQVAEGPAGES